MCYCGNYLANINNRKRGKGKARHYKCGHLGDFTKKLQLYTHPPGSHRALLCKSLGEGVQQREMDTCTVKLGSCREGACQSSKLETRIIGWEGRATASVQDPEGLMLLDKAPGRGILSLLPLAFFPFPCSFQCSLHSHVAWEPRGPRPCGPRTQRAAAGSTS